jgi:hypothetical protein
LLSYARAAASTVKINDPVTDTVQLWTGILASIEAAANDVIAIVSQDHAATAQTNSHAPKQIPAALAPAKADATQPTITSDIGSESAEPVPSPVPHLGSSCLKLLGVS